MGRSTENQANDDVGTLWCPNPNAGLIWDLTAGFELEEKDDECLHGLAVIHHSLALDREKQRERSHPVKIRGKSPE